MRMQILKNFRDRRLQKIARSLSAVPQISRLDFGLTSPHSPAPSSKRILEIIYIYIFIFFQFHSFFRTSAAILASQSRFSCAFDLKQQSNVAQSDSRNAESPRAVLARALIISVIVRSGTRACTHGRWFARGTGARPAVRVRRTTFRGRRQCPTPCATGSGFKNDIRRGTCNAPTRGEQ